MYEFIFKDYIARLFDTLNFEHGLFYLARVSEDFG
jgi:hypothetical protein